MITAVDIRSFRTCQKTKFNINSPLSSLIGQNGAGKTNILQAIERIGKIIRNEEIYSIDFINISIDLQVNHVKYQYNLTREFDVKEFWVFDSLIDIDKKHVIFKKHIIIHIGFIKMFCNPNSAASNSYIVFFNMFKPIFFT